MGEGPMNGVEVDAMREGMRTRRRNRGSRLKERDMKWRRWRLRRRERER